MGDIAVTVQNLVNLYRDVANAIRSKDGTSAPITPSDFAQRILNIPTGGGESQEWMEYSIHDLLKNSYTIDDSLLLNYNTWYLYNYEAKTIIQQELPSKVDITTININTFYLRFEQVLDDEDTVVCTKVNIVCSDNAVIWSLKYDNKEFALESGDYTKIVFTSDDVWQSLDTTRDIEFKILTYKYNEETYDDLLISNSDTANIFPTAILVDDIKIDYPELTTDVDTNYVLDNILGIDDPENYSRTFAPLVDYSYNQSMGELSWLYEDKASIYDVYLVVNDSENILIDAIENTQLPETTYYCSIFNRDNFNLSNYTNEDYLKVDTVIKGKRFFDKHNYLDINAPVSDKFIISSYNSQEDTIVFTIPQDASMSRYRLYNTLETYYEEHIGAINSLEASKMGESNKILAIAKENNKICNVDKSYILDTCPFTYEITDEGCDYTFTLQDNGWYECPSFNSVEAPVPGFAYAKITFHSTKPAKIKICTQSFVFKYNRDWGVISSLNKELSKSATSSEASGVSALNLRSQFSSQNFYEYRPHWPGLNYAYFMDIPEGDSFITIKFQDVDNPNYSPPDSDTIHNSLRFKIEEEKNNWNIVSSTYFQNDLINKVSSYSGSFIYNNKLYIQDGKNSYNTSMTVVNLDTEEVETTIPFNNTNYYVRGIGLLDAELGLFYLIATQDTYMSRILVYNINTMELVSSVSNVYIGGTSWSYVCSGQNGRTLYFTFSSGYSYLIVVDFSDLTSPKMSIIDFGNAKYYVDGAVVNLFYSRIVCIDDKIYFIGNVAQNEVNKLGNPMFYDIKNDVFGFEEDGLVGSVHYNQVYSGGVTCIDNRYIILLGSIISTNSYVYDILFKEFYKVYNPLPTTQSTPDAHYYNGIIYLVGGGGSGSTTAKRVYKIKLTNGVDLIEEGE